MTPRSSTSATFAERDLCPGATQANGSRCRLCSQPMPDGLVGYHDPDDGDVTFYERWVRQPYDQTNDDAAVGGADGHPLTWGRIAASHDSLVHHYPCRGRDEGTHADYDSSDEGAPPCPCQTGAMDDELTEALHDVSTWMRLGAICGSCWRNTCRYCHYSFEAADDAAGHLDGRLVCASCATARGLVAQNQAALPPLGWPLPPPWPLPGAAGGGEVF